MKRAATQGMRVLAIRLIPYRYSEPNIQMPRAKHWLSCIKSAIIKSTRITSSCFRHISLIFAEIVSRPIEHTIKLVALIISRLKW